MSDDRILLRLALFVVAVAGSFLLGRQFPVHHFVKWSQDPAAGFLLLDESTGKICNARMPADESNQLGHVCPK
jgi:hypothetical protein